MNYLPDELWLDLYNQIVIRNPDFDEDQLHVIMNVIDVMWIWGEDFKITDIIEDCPNIISLASFGDMFLEEQTVDG